MTLVFAGLVVIFASTVMSMAGLGAAAFYVPLFFWMGVPLREVLPTALFLNCIALSLATANYIRYGLVDFRIGLPTVITALLLAPLGALTAQHFERDVLLGLFAGFLVLVGLSMLFYRPQVSVELAVTGDGGVDVESPPGNVPVTKSSNADPDAAGIPELDPGKRLVIGSGVGALTGYIAGLLAIGGGVVVIPVLNYLRYPAKVTAATTGLVAFCASFSGFLGHVFFGQLNHSLLLVTGTAAALGALAGSWLVRYRISGSRLKTLIGVLVLLIAAKLLFDLLR
ncbi:MAG: sulfite exporter TauE/SafE family protein [Candidatus Desulforudis sp.]|nr:sulfite exporter TauE/SafE family protein [Desulforudis sp.]